MSLSLSLSLLSWNIILSYQSVGIGEGGTQKDLFYRVRGSSSSSSSTLPKLHQPQHYRCRFGLYRQGNGARWPEFPDALHTIYDRGLCWHVASLRCAVHEHRQQHLWLFDVIDFNSAIPGTSPVVRLSPQNVLHK